MLATFAMLATNVHSATMHLVTHPQPKPGQGEEDDNGHG